MSTFHIFDDSKIKYISINTKKGQNMRKEISRTSAAGTNLRMSAAGIFINIFFSFFSRKIFVLVLGKEFVGLSSLIGNIIAVLSLLDFGGASALAYHLYGALAKKDTLSVSAYIKYYRFFCRISSFLITACGVVLLPHLKYIVKGFDNTAVLYAAFLIFVLSNAADYFFSAEKVLLFADQKNYISQMFSYAFGAVGVALDAGVLLLTKNYIFYLCAHAVLSLIQDICLAVYVRKIYDDIDFCSKAPYDKKYRKTLILEMARLQPSNIAGTLSRTVDNFLVVSMFGVSQNGVYSNYNMLLGYAGMLSVTLIGALSASVGNLGAQSSKEHSEKIFGMTSLASFFLINLCTTLLFVMSRDVITLWLGSTLALPISCSLTLALCFFISGIRRVPLIFRDSFGLYKHEKLKPFAELFLSVALSVFFGKKFGISGIYLGQALSAFAVCLWYEPYLLYKHGFEKSVLPYYLRVIFFAATSALSCLCSFSLCRYINSVALKAFLCAIVSTLFFAAFFIKTDDFSALTNRLKRR